MPGKWRTKDHKWKGSMFQNETRKKRRGNVTGNLRHVVSKCLYVVDANCRAINRGGVRKRKSWGTVKKEAECYIWTEYSSWLKRLEKHVSLKRNCCVFCIVFSFIVYTWGRAALFEFNTTNEKLFFFSSFLNVDIIVTERVANSLKLVLFLYFFFHFVVYLFI